MARSLPDYSTCLRVKQWNKLRYSCWSSQMMRMKHNLLIISTIQCQLHDWWTHYSPHVWKGKTMRDVSIYLLYLYILVQCQDTGEEIHKQQTCEPGRMGIVIPNVSTRTSNLEATGMGKSGWHRTPPGDSIPASTPVSPMSTPSPAIATVNGFPSCSIAFMVAISPDGITRTYQKIQMNFFSHTHMEALTNHNYAWLESQVSMKLNQKCLHESTLWKSLQGFRV